jgi:hypothetical protein
LRRITGFSPSGDGGPPPDPEEMRRRLADPLTRAQVRKDERVQVQARHPDMALVLGIEAPLEARLLDLLTDQQLQHLDLYYSEIPPRADMEVRNKQQIRELLGEALFERYLDYGATLAERWHVAHFCARLDPPDALTGPQKERLLALLHTHRERLRGGPAIPNTPVVPALEDYMRRRNIELNENAFRRMREDGLHLLQQLPDLLAPRQLEAYARMEEEKIARQREYVRQMRREAGLPAEFDETRPAVRHSTPTLAEGQVKVEISMTINNSPAQVTEFRVANGKTTPGWRAPEGLWVEARPSVFSDGWRQVHFQFYEDVDERRRPLGGGFRTGFTARAQDRRSGGGATLSGVNKAYAIAVQVKLNLL